MRGQLFADPVELAAREANEAALVCPVCAAALEPRSFAGQAVDRCPAGHGVWLDDGELAASLREVAPPGGTTRPG